MCTGNGEELLYIMTLVVDPECQRQAIGITSFFLLHKISLGLWIYK